jgi:hypothetical protein
MDSAYRCIDHIIALHVSILPQPVVRLAERDARQAASEKAQIRGRQAREETVRPGARCGRRSVVPFLVREGLVEAVLPVLDVGLVDDGLGHFGGGIGGLGMSGVSWIGLDGIGLY